MSWSCRLLTFVLLLYCVGATSLPKYREALPRLVAAFQQAGGTDLGPHLGPLWQTDWEGLTADWLEFCKRY